MTKKKAESQRLYDVEDMDKMIELLEQILQTLEQVAVYIKIISGDEIVDTKGDM